jgi:hypothetical protein
MEWTGFVCLWCCEVERFLWPELFTCFVTISCDVTRCSWLSGHRRFVICCVSHVRQSNISWTSFLFKMGLSDCLLFTINNDKPITINPPDMLLSAAHKLVPTDHSKGAVWAVGLQRLVCCYCGFESRWWLECLFCEWCMLLSRDFYVGPITRPEESWRVWCAWVWLSNIVHCPWATAAVHAWETNYYPNYLHTE